MAEDSDKIYVEELKANSLVMTGAIDMGTNRIINMDDPVNPQDAATKDYVDNTIAPVFAAGALYLSPNYATPLTINITVAGQWEQVYPLTAHDNTNITLDGPNGTATIQASGFYLASGCVTTRTASAHILEFAWTINGVSPLGEHIFGGTEASGSSNWTNLGYSSLHVLSAGDVVRFVCRNYDGTTDIDIANVQFNVFKVA